MKTLSPPIFVQAQERLVTLLALIAGYVDAYGYITYATYVSFMSGNTTQTGFNIGEGYFAESIPFFTAIVFFVIGLIAGNLLAYSNKYQARKTLFRLIAFLLGLVIIIFQMGYLNNSLHIATISFAMGIMNTAVSQVGAQLVSLTFVTGTLNRMAKHIALGIQGLSLPDTQGLWDTHWRRAVMLARVWGAFLFGAILSGMATPRFSIWTLLLPIFILLILAVFNPSTEVE